MSSKQVINDDRNGYARPSPRSGSSKLAVLIPSVADSNVIRVGTTNKWNGCDAE